MNSPPDPESWREALAAFVCCVLSAAACVGAMYLAAPVQP